jgi:hypothetical protein
MIKQKRANHKVRPFAVFPHINLLILTLTVYKCVISRTANADVGSIVARNSVIPTAAQDAVISAEAVNGIRARTTYDQVIAIGTDHDPIATDKVG